MSAKEQIENDVSVQSEFLRAMARAANTVYLVTTDGPSGRAGVTVTAMSSVSADVSTPRLLICLHHESATAQVIRANGVFCVNMLGEAHQSLASRFAGRMAEGEDKFDMGDWARTRAGLPRLRDALASFDCRLSEESLVGTHHILFGAVHEAIVNDDAPPLLYHMRGYGAVAKD